MVLREITDDIITVNTHNTQMQTHVAFQIRCHKFLSLLLLRLRYYKVFFNINYLELYILL